MFKLLVFVAIVYTVSGAWFEESSLKWTGRRESQNKYFQGWSLEQVKSLMGARMEEKPGAVHPVKGYSGVNLDSLPVNFTSGIDKWPKCNLEISYIKDQAACGSCWAVAASSVIGNRICIANYASIPDRHSSNEMVGLNEPQPLIDMSAEQILSCCSWCGDGCKGGYPIDAMHYWKGSWFSGGGVVTGGWYGSNCGCYPYEVPPCPKGCEEGPTPKCKKSCRSGFPLTQSQDKHFANDYYKIRGSVSDIMTEIYDHGPVECAFTVYDNFMHYPVGDGIVNDVYVSNRNAKELGGHAITVIGWGVASRSAGYPNGIPYWLINNSWNVTWGLGGSFKYLRGSDLGGMESGCVAGTAKPQESNILLQC